MVSACSGSNLRGSPVPSLSTLEIEYLLGKGKISPRTRLSLATRAFFCLILEAASNFSTLSRRRFRFVVLSTISFSTALWH